MKQETRKCLLLVGIFLLFFIVANILISNMLFIFKIEITKFNMIIAYAITVILILLLLKKLGLSKYNKIKNIMLVIVLPTILILLSLFLNSKVMDFSYDGNTYHKATIGLLKEGWNPVYETASEFDNSRKNKIYIENSSSELWTDCYARATHIFQANAYALTGSIESGKAVNTLSILSLFLIIFSYLSLKLKKIIFPLMFASCCATYSVVSAQYLTMYIDFFVYIYLLLLLLSFFIIEFNQSEQEQNIGFLIYSLSLIMLINIKFNSFAYAGIFCLGYYIYYIIKLIKHKIEKKFFVKFTIISTVCVIIGTCIIGLSVYVKNFIEYGNPFYPLFGEDKVDIITTNQPYEFKDKSTIEKYFISMFSEVENMAQASQRETNLKIPFTIRRTELNYISAPDTRISGNGVLFSGIFIISVLLLLVTSIKMYKDNKKVFIMCSIPLTITILMILLLSESWWARYFPQTYFIILTVILYLYFLKRKMYKSFLLILITLILINNSITFIQATRYNYSLTKSANNEFRLIKENVDKENERLVIKTPIFIGSLYNISDNLKDYEIVVLKRNSDEELNNSLMNGLAYWKWESNE